MATWSSRALGASIVLVTLVMLARPWPSPFDMSAPQDAEDDRCAPPTLRLGDFVRIDRVAESRRGLKLAEALREAGGVADAAGLYEFRVFPDKPTLYFVAGRGSIDAERLRDLAVDALKGVRRDDHAVLNKDEAGTRYACTEFAIGSGMVAMSVANNGTVEKGRAGADSPPGQLYESHSPNGARCLSVRSYSGELFMVRSVSAYDWTGTRGPSLPTCPDRAFPGRI